jgi:sugar phosphate isomerase/epimerase
MARIVIGVNMEFVRSADKPFAWGVAKAAELGYEYVEPMVHLGRELLSEAGYFHSVSMLSDPLEMRKLYAKQRVRLSGLSAHYPLMRPEVSVDYLTQAIRFAAEAGAPVVNTDEGVKSDFTDERTDFELMRYVLTRAARVAERRKITIGLEPHQIYSKTPGGLDRIYGVVESPAIGINFDTGNAYLAGQDPYRWLERVRDRVVHIHAKDVSIGQSEAQRGHVTGTPVGCACGEGVIDWERVIAVLRPVDRSICLSVECGTVDQAAASLAHVRKCIERGGV